MSCEWADALNARQRMRRGNRDEPFMASLLRTSGEHRCTRVLHAPACALVLAPHIGHQTQWERPTLPPAEARDESTRRHTTRAADRLGLTSDPVRPVLGIVMGEGPAFQSFFARKRQETSPGS